MAKLSWNLPNDFWVIQRRARWMRTLRIKIEGEPEQKGARGKRSAVAFQQQVIDTMVAFRRRPFTGPVALDLSFTSTRKNPPAIHRLAKHVLDLLGKADPEVRPPRRSVLYRDDRQVKFLYVHLNQAWNPNEGTRGTRTASTGPVDPWDLVLPRVELAPWLDDEEHTVAEGSPSWPTEFSEDLVDGASRRDGKPVEERKGSMFLDARPGRDVVDDLIMANRLWHFDDEDDESSLFSSPELPNDFEENWDRRQHGSADTGLWEYIERSSHFHHLMQFQEAVLALIDAGLFAGLCMYLDGLSRAIPPNCPEEYRSKFEGHLRDSRTISRRQLLAHPLTLRLPGLPRTSRQGEEFALALRQSMEDFKVRRPMFNLLMVPVKATFLVVPPERGKDLDNIALTVLPIMHDVLRPHIEPHILLAPSHPEDEPQPWRVEALRRLRLLNANSVTAYQVIELPRTPQDPPEGILRLALGAVSYQSWWDQAADYVDEHIEEGSDLKGWDLGNW